MREWTRLVAVVFAGALASVPRGLPRADAADPPPLAPIAVWDSFADAGDLSLSGDGGVLLVGSPYLGTALLDAVTGKKLRSSQGDEASMRVKACFAGGARRLVVRSCDDKIPVIVNGGTGAKRGTLERPPQRTPTIPKTEPSVEIAVPAAGSSLFAVWDSDPYVDVHDVETGKIKHSLSFAPPSPKGSVPEFAAVSQIAASADGRFLSVVADRNGVERLCLCDLGTGAKGPEKRSWADLPESEWRRVFLPLALSDDGSRLLTLAKGASEGQTEFLVWNTGKGTVAWKLPDGVRECATRGDVVAIVSDGAVSVRDVGTGEVRFVSFLAGDPSWAVTQSEKTLRVWNPVTGFLRKSFEQRALSTVGPVYPVVAASPAKPQVLVDLEHLTLWDGEGTARRAAEAFYSAGLAAFSPDGARYAVQSGSLARVGYGVFDARSGEPVWLRQKDLVQQDREDLRHDWIAMRFTPNGERLIRVGNERFAPEGRERGGLLRACNADDGSPQWSVSVPGAVFADLVFRPDGKALLIATSGALDLDTRTGETTPATDLPAGVRCAAFSPKSVALYVGLASGLVLRVIR